MMKKKIITAALLVISCPAFLCLIVLKIEQLHIHQAMWEKIKESASEAQLVEIDVPVKENNSFKCNNEEKEITLKGAMYDIVRIDTTHGLIRYFCIKDNEEWDLINKANCLLSNQLDLNHNGNDKNTFKLLKALFYPLYLHSPQINLGCYTRYKAINYRDRDFIFFLENYPEPILAPPWANA